MHCRSVYVHPRKLLKAAARYRNEYRVLYTYTDHCAGCNVCCVRLPWPRCARRELQRQPDMAGPSTAHTFDNNSRTAEICGLCVQLQASGCRAYISHGICDLRLAPPSEAHTIRSYSAPHTSPPPRSYPRPLPGSLMELNILPHALLTTLPTTRATAHTAVRASRSTSSSDGRARSDKMPSTQALSLSDSASSSAGSAAAGSRSGGQSSAHTQ